MSFKDKLNRYTCRACDAFIVTIDREDGVTPFLIGCRATPGCNGLAQSSCYRGVPTWAEPSHEWRKPTPTELFKASKAMREHVAMGGLDIYPVKP